MGDRQLLAARSWRWLRVRIVGLIYGDTTRIARKLAPPPDQTRR